MTDRDARLIVVTGASGAGLSTALKILEDSAVKAVDNLPLAMIDDLVDIELGKGGRSLAVGFDARTTGFSPDAARTLVERLRGAFDKRFTLVFIEASRDDLMRRFNATRRQHPLGEGLDLAAAVKADLARMADLAPLADIRLDTSGARPADLRLQLLAGLGIEALAPVQVRVLSFSYRRRIPEFSDIVMDMRFADNPYWQHGLAGRDGRDKKVAAFLDGDKSAAAVMADFKSMLDRMLPRVSHEGRPVLSIAFGCTGGRHRSVWAAEKAAGWLREAGHGVEVVHRDIDVVR